MLVIKDPDIRRDMVALLEGETGMEALEILDDGPEPCLVPLDFMMPVMNGLEFLDPARERALDSRLRVVLVSGNGQLASRVKDPDVAGVLSKPFRAEDLLDLVHRDCGDGAQS